MTEFFIFVWTISLNYFLLSLWKLFHGNLDMMNFYTSWNKAQLRVEKSVCAPSVVRPSNWFPAGIVNTVQKVKSHRSAMIDFRQKYFLERRHISGASLKCKKSSRHWILLHVKKYQVDSVELITNVNRQAVLYLLNCEHRWRVNSHLFIINVNIILGDMVYFTDLLLDQKQGSS